MIRLKKLLQIFKEILFDQNEPIENQVRILSEKLLKSYEINMLPLIEIRNLVLI
jgi:hypothetical protein